jgi:hypothetical protein
MQTYSAYNSDFLSMYKYFVQLICKFCSMVKYCTKYITLIKNTNKKIVKIESSEIFLEIFIIRKPTMQSEFNFDA